MTDVAEIARGLTKAQREAVASIKGLFNYATFCGLPNCGIARKHHRSAAWQLTPLGLAVRAHLTQEQPR